MTIRSNPPGAVVFVDNYEIGVTPVSTDYIYYGTREFRLERDGYQTVREFRTVSAPFYQYFPLDFFAENVVPLELRDQRTVDFQMIPQTIVPTEELLGRADNLRLGGGADGAVVPAALPPAFPPAAGPPVEMLPPITPAQQQPEFRFPQ